MWLPLMFVSLERTSGRHAAGLASRTLVARRKDPLAQHSCLVLAASSILRGGIL